MIECRTPATPWDFQNRFWVSGLIYFVGFTLGYALQYAIFGRAEPIYAIAGKFVGVQTAAVLAAAIAFVGYLLRVWGSSYLGSGIVWSKTVRAETLRVSGPYRYLRNPLYLGSLLMAVGLGLFGPPLATLLIVGLTLAFVYRVIFIEEAFLVAQHGEAYRRYRGAVPRLLPRLRAAALPIAPERVNFADGFFGELFMLGFAAGVFYMALFDWREPVFGGFWVFFGAGLLAQILANAVRRRAAPERG